MERSRSDTDRRQVHLFLTDLGQQAYARSHQMAHTLLAAVVERLGPDSTRSLTENLKLANATVQEVLSTQRQKGNL